MYSTNSKGAQYLFRPNICSRTYGALPEDLLDLRQMRLALMLNPRQHTKDDVPHPQRRLEVYWVFVVRTVTKRSEAATGKNTYLP